MVFLAMCRRPEHECAFPEDHELTFFHSTDSEPSPSHHPCYAEDVALLPRKTPAGLVLPIELAVILMLRLQDSDE